MTVKPSVQYTVILVNKVGLATKVVTKNGHPLTLENAEQLTYSSDNIGSVRVNGRSLKTVFAMIIKGVIVDEQVASLADSDWTFNESIVIPDEPITDIVGEVRLRDEVERVINGDYIDDCAFNIVDDMTDEQVAQLDPEPGQDDTDPKYRVEMLVMNVLEDIVRGAA